jgi:hypothetical protein
VPVNHRCFLISRGDLETEEYRRDIYTKLKLDINDLPTYSKNRLKSNDSVETIELKEAILAASLKNRYVEIILPKPKNKDLYKTLKKDMEYLSDELGFEYSTDSKGIKCTFKFPKHDIKYYAMESKICVQNALAEIDHFCSLVTENKFEGALANQDELMYNIGRLEILMDRYYSDSLNIMWDLPNLSPPGYFLWINACELILDEILFITKETANALKILKPEDIRILEMERDIFGYVWEKATEKCLKYCATAISTIELEPSSKTIETAYSMINEYEHHRKKIDTSQSKFIKLFTGEDRYFKDPKSAQRLMAASFHLNNIFQASERIVGFSNSIVKNTLRLSKL